MNGEFLFGLVEDAVDVLLVHCNYEKGNEERKQKIRNGRRRTVERVHHHRVKECRRNAGCGNDLRSGKHQAENKSEYEEDQGIDQKNGQ